jgi:hypothetical protein
LQFHSNALESNLCDYPNSGNKIQVAVNVGVVFWKQHKQNTQVAQQSEGMPPEQPLDMDGDFQDIQSDVGPSSCASNVELHFN